MKLSLSNKVMRIVITLLGIAFILQAAGSLTLGLIGERTTGVITHIRRELGERNETTPNRYTYIISYSFKTHDGQVVKDSTRHIGGAVYVKASGAQTIAVRYLKNYPVFNTIEKDAQFSWGKVALLATGVFLILVMNRPRKQSKTLKQQFRDKSSVPSHANNHQNGMSVGGSMGFSSKINDPAFARYIKNTTRWSYLFSSILAVIAVVSFYIYGETSREMSNPEALYIGMGIGSMFVAIATLQMLDRKRNRTWDGVVADKQIEQKQRKKNYGNHDYSWQTVTLYTVVIRRDDGKMHTIKVENDETLYNYYQIGDRVRHHKGLNSLEKYDKSNDAIVFCNACASLNDIQDDYCFRCKCPLLK